MKLLQKMIIFSAFAYGLSSVPAMAAYMEFTYNSQTVPWKSSRHYYLDYQYGPDYPYDPPSDFAPPSFSYSFLVPSTSLSLTSPTDLIIEDVKVSVNPDVFTYYPRTLISAPHSWGRITVNPDGAVAAWDFDVAMTELITPESDEATRDTKFAIGIFSSGGSKTCDCDFVRLRMNNGTWRPYHYYVLGLMDFNYEGPNTSDSWSVKYVSEPSAGALAMMSLGLLALMRSRKKVSGLDRNISTTMA